MRPAIERTRVLKKGDYSGGPIIYWMGRDQRTMDNWAMIYAQHKALEYEVPLIVIFNLVPTFLDATLRQYDFMIRGLKDVEEGLRKKNIPFYLLIGNPVKNIPQFVEQSHAGLLITDFEPLTIKTKWKRSVARSVNIPFEEVDARNIVPCWVASNKQEFGAYTIRPKIHRILDEFLINCPSLKKHPHPFKKTKQINWKKVYQTLEVDKRVKPIEWIKPGEKAALQAMLRFIKTSLSKYETDRNDPTKNGSSNLSPYLHFGHLSSGRLALEVKKSKTSASAKKAFIEELVIRRELSDNYCFYAKDYLSIESVPEWAQKTLKKHKRDKRDFLYTLKQFEEAKTHDNAWNAAQREMMVLGKMHGYMRMYWAKKILEWSTSPEQAIKIAVYLNDKYELDGRDTNGYAGIMWSIAGLHDRAWGERRIYGKIRCMTYNGLRSKFNINEYIEKHLTNQ